MGTRHLPKLKNGISQSTAVDATSPSRRRLIRLLATTLRAVPKLCNWYESCSKETVRNPEQTALFLNGVIDFRPPTGWGRHSPGNRTQLKGATPWPTRRDKGIAS